MASDSESASSAREAGPGAGSSTSGSGSHGPTYDSRRARADLQDVDREPRRHRRHPGGRLVDRAFLARQAQERLLGHVLGLRDAAEHPVRHAEAVPPQRLELLVGDRDGHGSPDDISRSRRDRRPARLAPASLPDGSLPDRVARGATLVGWGGAGRPATVGREPPARTDATEGHPPRCRIADTILAAGAALAALAPASAALARSAPAPASGTGVPAGRIELTIRSVHVTGSHAVPRYERTRQYVTADESHTITTTVPQHKLRFEGFTSPRRDLRYDAATNRVTFSKGSATPPYRTVAQEAAAFARQVAQGCWTQPATSSSMAAARPPSVRPAPRGEARRQRRPHF